MELRLALDQKQAEPRFTTLCMIGLASKTVCIVKVCGTSSVSYV